MLMIPALTRRRRRVPRRRHPDRLLRARRRLAPGRAVKIGKRAFVGNSGMAAPGRKVPKAGLVAVLSAAPAPQDAKAGTSWLGSPPTRCADVPATTDDEPHVRARRARLQGRARRSSSCAGVVPLLLPRGARRRGRRWRCARLSGLAAARGASLAGLVLIAARRRGGARHRRRQVAPGRQDAAGEHPLWSSFVWRNELADTFVEVLAAPWFASAATGTPVLNVWLRPLGARVGRGVWCETYWLPEADLVTLGPEPPSTGAACVQTHLFHDRMLSMDTVTLGRGATLGPHSVILPAATIGRHATVGPVSLVMRGESVPTRRAGSATRSDPGPTAARCPELDCPPQIPTSPATATHRSTSRTTTSSSTTSSIGNRLDGRRGARRRRARRRT